MWQTIEQNILPTSQCLSHLQLPYSLIRVSRPAWSKTCTDTTFLTLAIYMYTYMYKPSTAAYTTSTLHVSVFAISLVNLTQSQKELLQKFSTCIILFFFSRAPLLTNPSSQNGTFVLHVPVGTYSEPFLYQLFCLCAIYGNCRIAKIVEM